MMALISENPVRMHYHSYLLSFLRVSQRTLPRPYYHHGSWSINHGTKMRPCQLLNIFVLIIHLDMRAMIAGTIYRKTESIEKWLGLESHLYVASLELLLDGRFWWYFGFSGTSDTSELTANNSCKGWIIFFSPV